MDDYEELTGNLEQLKTVLSLADDIDDRREVQDLIKVVILSIDSLIIDHRKRQAKLTLLELTKTQ